MTDLFQDAEDVADVIVEHKASEIILLRAYSFLIEKGGNEPRTRKLLAEICFLLARIFRTKADSPRMNSFSRESFNIYRSLSITAFEDTAPILWPFVPSIMHEDVVKAEFDV